MVKQNVFAILLLCASAALLVWAYLRGEFVTEIVSAGVIVGMIALAFLYRGHQRRQIESRKGDIEYLRDRLRLHGVEDSDIDEFKTALETDPQPTQRHLTGERVGVWIEEMLHKSVSGVWQIPVSEADSLLATTVVEYYGWS